MPWLPVARSAEYLLFKTRPVVANGSLIVIARLPRAVLSTACVVATLRCDSTLFVRGERLDGGLMLLELSLALPANAASRQPLETKVRWYCHEWQIGPVCCFPEIRFCAWLTCWSVVHGKR